MTGKVSGTAMEQPSAENGQSNIVRVIAVGDPTAWREKGNRLPTKGMAFMAFQEVCEETLRLFRPKFVFSPVLARSFDCVELAFVLKKLGFDGGYRAICQSLPRPDLIEAEVCQICPGLDFKIVKTL